MIFKPRIPPTHKSKAQAMVEFALALPILLLVVYGLLESGRLLFIYASVVTAARQAARYGSATGLTPA
ncbi:MAG: TadE family protein, partial [Bacteroidota bacterium]